MKTRNIALVMILLMTMPVVQESFAKGESIVSATVGTPFDLKIGQTAIFEAENIELHFLNVTDDSRCPSDVTCVWEGLVTILVNINLDGQDLGNFKLTQRGGDEDWASQNFVGQKIELVEVNPYPKSTTPIQFSDYAVTLVVSDTQDRTIIIPSGTATKGCETKKTCYFPNDVTITQNTELTWKNMDSEVHTVTSGNMLDGPDGVFSSGLLSTGETFSYKFTTMRPYDYYCMLHPWQTGSVNVEFEPFDVDKRIIREEGISSDGSVTVIVEATEPINTEQLGIHLYFKNSTQDLITDINYDLEVIQNSKTIFSLEKQSTHAGIAEHWTEPLQYDSPVDVKVTILGIGLPDDESNWTGPKGEIMMFSAIPEFSSLLFIVIATAFAGIFLVKPLSRTNFKL